MDGQMQPASPEAGSEVAWTHTAGGSGELSVSEAARSLAMARYKRDAGDQERQAAQAETPAAAEAESASQEADAAPQAEATGETQADDPADDLPPLELPRSWTRDQSDNWKALPRSVQEFLSQQASKDSEAVRRSQNEAAEQRKAFEAKLSEVEKVRQDYESRLPALAAAIEATIQNQFADIQSIADVRRMQAEDPFRFQQWQLHQMELQTVQAQKAEAEKHQTETKIRERNDYRVAQTKLLLEKVPELSDAKKFAETQTRAVEFLKDYGFADAELAELGESRFSDNANFQRLVLDAMAFRDGQKAKAQVLKASPPPVLRPGAPKAPSAGIQAQIQTLKSQLDKASGLQAVRIGAEITKLERQAGRR